MNDWFVVFEVHSRGEIIRYEVLLMAENAGVAMLGVALMGRTWWPDCLKEESAHWHWGRGDVYLHTLWQVDDTVCAMPSDFRFVDRQTAAVTPEGVVVYDEWDERWETLFRWRWQEGLNLQR
ncbi:hypothetical protein [Pantoea agglomerans]